MSGCLDSIHCNVDFGVHRNAVSSVIAGALYFSGLWLVIDTQATNGPENWCKAYLLITGFSTLAMLMVNAISNSQVRGEALHESVLGTKGARLWLMTGFVLTFASLVAAVWILFSDYVLRQGDHTVWPGVALFFHAALIFAASLTYKFGRTEELWG